MQNWVSLLLHACILVSGPGMSVCLFLGELISSQATGWARNVGTWHLTHVSGSIGTRLGLDKLLFILPYYSIVVFSNFLPIILLILPNILFIMPIIPSLNTVHHMHQIDSCYIDSSTNPTLLHVTWVEMHMHTTLIANVFIGGRCLWDNATIKPRLTANCC